MPLKDSTVWKLVYDRNGKNWFRPNIYPIVNPNLPSNPSPIFLPTLAPHKEIELMLNFKIGSREFLKQVLQLHLHLI